MQCKAAMQLDIPSYRLVSYRHLKRYWRWSTTRARFRSNNEGENSQVYPALAQVPRDLFGVCVVSILGNVYAVGNTQYDFLIMSVSWPRAGHDRPGWATTKLHSGGDSGPPTVNSAGASTSSEIGIPPMPLMDDLKQGANK
jgi:hypothetical protein